MTWTTRAAVLRTFGADPELLELGVPTPGPGALVVEVEAATVCGTDVHIADGRFTGLAQLPLVLGHEGCGRVVEAGPGGVVDATGRPLVEGDRIVWAHPWCGTCYHCAVARQPTLCSTTLGFGWGPLTDAGVNGTFSQYVNIPARARTLRVPDGIGSPLAASATCALRTVMHAFQQAGPRRFSDSVLVQGSGPVGLYAAAVALEAGTFQTLLLGAPRERLEFTAGWGLAAVLDVETTTFDERFETVMAATGGRGADLVLECAGPPEAFTEALSLVRKGGTLVVVGQAGNVPVPVDTTQLKVRQLVVRGSLSADISHYYDALRFLSRHEPRYGFQRMIDGSRYRLEDVGAALSAMRDQRGLKPVVLPS